MDRPNHIYCYVPDPTSCKYYYWIPFMIGDWRLIKFHHEFLNTPFVEHNKLHYLDYPD